MIKTANSQTHTQVRSAAVFISLILSTISIPGAYAQGAALQQLSSRIENTAPVPEASLASLVAAQDDSKTFISREAERIMRLSPAALAAVTPDQRLQMLKTLIKGSTPNQNNSDNSNQDQDNLEEAILRVLGSAPDAASFDYVYYRLEHNGLNYSVSWYGDVQDLVKKYHSTVIAGDWEGLGNYVNSVANSAYTGRNLIKFLIDGKDVIPVASEELRAAQKSIHIEVFQLQADNIGQGLADLLSAKAKAGLKVRLMIDEHGSKADDDTALIKMLDGMRASGVAIIIKKPPFLKSHLDHRKVVVIDGKTGFTGGMNIGRWYQVDWHDQQTLIKGPAVGKLQEAFVERWKTAGGSIGENEELFPAIEEYQGGSETQVVQHIGKRDQNIKAMYLRAIGTAQKSIRIANPYFTDKDIIAGLRAAARRGVKVQVVLPKENDQALVQRASRASYPKLIKAGVQIYEYKGRMAHEKVAVFDGRWATFGSSNLDERSLRNNDELNLVVTDYRVAQEIESRLFDADLPNCDLVNSFSPALLDHLVHQFSGLL